MADAVSPNPDDQDRSTQPARDAARSARAIEAACPLPPLYEDERVIACRRLVRHDGVEYWSRVYDLGDRIIKQATLDLAAREARILSRLEGPFFPRALDTQSEETFSVATIEKVRGEPLSVARALPPAEFQGFARACLSILNGLRAAGIEHRDIRAENVLVRDGSPVLIDFGWAIADGEPTFSPRWLGAEGRPPDGGSDDGYSMGKLLERLAPAGHLTTIARSMTDPDPSLRIRRLAVLRDLVDTIERMSAW